MVYGNCKVYNDGSHYIAIPYSPNPTKNRCSPPEEIIEIKEDIEATEESETKQEFIKNMNENTENLDEKEPNTSAKSRKVTKKELFEELYQKHIDLSKSARKKLIIEAMLPYFADKQATKLFVEAQFERKQRNLICRRVRLSRKIFLANFNYFCTFTYDNAKHNEDSFKKKLRATFRNLTYRKGWKYAGVWERALGTNRLHFHGLFHIPDGTMVGDLIDVNDYDKRNHRRQNTKQNTYFNERFGRSDFKEIENRAILGSSIAYLVKYMEKAGEKIVYSKGLPQYFISDIMAEDVVCNIGQEDKKLLLFDDFTCWDEGEYIGQVSTDTIGQMRKSN